MYDEVVELFDALASRPEARPVSSDAETIRREISKLEGLAGFALPDVYLAWLKKFEFATIDTTTVFGIVGEGNLFQQQSDYLQRGWLNIANDGCGNYYALVLSGEFGLAAPVIFVDAYSELDQVIVVASDFVQFLNGLMVNESGAFHWPFDSVQTLRLDPKLQTATQIRLPWAE